MTDYPFVPAYFDNLGLRKGPTLGIMYHMAEGGGTVGYLDKSGNPPGRGVSVHAVCEYSGRVVQMLKWRDASGSLNPANRSTDKPYFGHSKLVAVLGDWWRDPNSVVVSMEIEGFARTGPNADQVESAIAWGRDMKALFPSIRGALGHADQTDTKGCPGTSDSMKAIFEGVGGHGLWSQAQAGDDTMGLSLALRGPAGKLAIAAGVDSIRVADGEHYKVATAVDRDAYGAQIAPDGSTGYVVNLRGSVEHFIRASEPVVFKPADGPAAPADPALVAAVDKLEAAVAALKTQVGG